MLRGLVVVQGQAGAVPSRGQGRVGRDVQHAFLNSSSMHAPPRQRERQPAPCRPPAGANVILTTKGIDDVCLKYFVEAGAIACRRVPKDDLR